MYILGDHYSIQYIHLILYVSVPYTYLFAQLSLFILYEIPTWGRGVLPVIFALQLSLSTWKGASHSVAVQ